MNSRDTAANFLNPIPSSKTLLTTISKDNSKLGHRFITPSVGNGKSAVQPLEKLWLISQSVFQGFYKRTIAPWLSWGCGMHSSALLAGAEVRTRSHSCPSLSVPLVMALTCLALTWCLAASPQVLSCRASVRVSHFPDHIHDLWSLVKFQHLPTPFSFVPNFDVAGALSLCVFDSWIVY